MHFGSFPVFVVASDSNDHHIGVADTTPRYAVLVTP
jgi:hypothetical protein